MSITLPKIKNILPPLPALRDFINMYKLDAKKVLSQNYLMDLNVIRKIVRKANLNDDYVIEIGPGPGGITRALLETNCKRLDVIEIDQKFIKPLEILQLMSNNRLFIHNKNIMTVDIQKIWSDANVPTTLWYDHNPPSFHIIGNLPFNIASPLIIKFLKEIVNRTGPWSFGRVPLTLTFQLEVAKRIVGKIDSDSRSRISLMAQYITEPQLVYEIPGNCFAPKPKVNVGVVRFEPRIEPLIYASFELVEKFARCLFMHRNKYICKNIKMLYPKNLQKELTNDLLQHCKVNPEILCVHVGMEEFIDMCHYYQKQCFEIPGLYFYDYSRTCNTLEVLKEKSNVFPPLYKFQKLDKIQKEGICFNEFKNL